MLATAAVNHTGALCCQPIGAQMHRLFEAPVTAASVSAECTNRSSIVGYTTSVCQIYKPKA